MAKMASFRLFLTMVAMRRSPLYPFVSKSAYLHGNLAEEVYIGLHMILLLRGSLMVMYGTLDLYIYMYLLSITGPPTDAQSH